MVSHGRPNHALRTKISPKHNSDLLHSLNLHLAHPSSAYVDSLHLIRELVHASWLCEVEPIGTIHRVCDLGRNLLLDAIHGQCWECWDTLHIRRLLHRSHGLLYCRAFVSHIAQLVYRYKAKLSQALLLEKASIELNEKSWGEESSRLEHGRMQGSEYLNLEKGAHRGSWVKRL